MLFKNEGKLSEEGAHERRACVGYVEWRYKPRLFGVIWSSEEAHTVDALAVGGEEGRGSLRKASGSRQAGVDPEISEWGNLAIARWLSASE